MSTSLTASVLALLTLTVATPTFADHGRDFHCSGIPFSSGLDKQAMSRLAHNNGMRQIIGFLAAQWENEEMRRLCDAATSGEKIDQSCFDGRRDWEEIAARIPKGLRAKSNAEIRPTMLELSERGYHTTGRKEALQYCANLGVISDVFK